MAQLQVWKKMLNPCFQSVLPLPFAASIDLAALAKERHVHACGCCSLWKETLVLPFNPQGKKCVSDVLKGSCAAATIQQLMLHLLLFLLLPKLGENRAWVGFSTRPSAAR